MRQTVYRPYVQLASPLTARCGSVSVRITVDGSVLAILKAGERIGTGGRKTAGLAIARIPNVRVTVIGGRDSSDR